MNAKKSTNKNKPALWGKITLHVLLTIPLLILFLIPITMMTYLSSPEGNVSTDYLVVTFVVLIIICVGFLVVNIVKRTKKLMDKHEINTVKGTKEQDESIEPPDSYQSQQEPVTNSTTEVITDSPEAFPTSHTAPPENSHLEEETASSTSTLVISKNVLLVDDNEINQELVTDLLEAVGSTVTIANNGQEALDLVAQQHFDCVLMDINMPVMGGFAATRAIRKLPNMDQLPVIALTAHLWEDIEPQCLHAGINGYLTKPIDPQELYSLIKDL